MGNKGPILVILAAGVGSRYGGLKQMDKIGAGGETLIDYSVFDALRSGFTRVVFVIRHDIEADFKNIVLSRMKDKVPYDLVFQEQDSFAPPDIAAYAKSTGRAKPWGTAHALLCASSYIDAPFCIINADDFYGRAAFEVMGKYLSSDSIVDSALVPYKLAKTLSPRGTVTRGVCVIENDYLASIDELKALRQSSPGFVVNEYEDGSIKEFKEDVPVSMNFWGFTPDILPHVESYFKEFILKEGKGPKAECYIPLAADRFIRDGIIKIRALYADSPWFGVTYREDHDMVCAEIEKLVTAGIYQPKLWTDPAMGNLGK